MGTQFWWIFDALMVIIAVSVIYSNAKRGMTKVLILSLGYIITTVLASVMAAVAAEPLYESVARGTNVTNIETTNKKVDFVTVFANAINQREYGFICNPGEIKTILCEAPHEDFAHALYQYATHRGGTLAVESEENFRMYMVEAFRQAYAKEIGDRMPEYVRMNFEERLKEDPDVMCQIIGQIFNASQSPTVAAEVIEDAFSREPTTEVLQIFVFLIIFSIMMVFAALLSAAMQYKMFFNITKATDHVVGGLLGVLEAGTMLVMFTMVVRLLVLLNGGDLLCFNDKTIANTQVFHYLYDSLRTILL